MNTMNTQTPEELEEQSVKAYAAWRKDRSTPIEYLHSKHDTWVSVITPTWDSLYSWRIKPEPPKPVEVEVWWQPNSGRIIVSNTCDGIESRIIKSQGYVRATATIKVKDGE